VLRTGAWGRDIFVPVAIVGIAAGGLGAGFVAGLEVFRAYSFESDFWKWLNQTVLTTYSTTYSTSSWRHHTFYKYQLQCYKSTHVHELG
jgi:hypothetical protein